MLSWHVFFFFQPKTEKRFQQRRWSPGWGDRIRAVSSNTFGNYNSRFGLPPTQPETVKLLQWHSRNGQIIGYNKPWIWPPPPPTLIIHWCVKLVKHCKNEETPCFKIDIQAIPSRRLENLKVGLKVSKSRFKSFLNTILMDLFIYFFILLPLYIF